MPADARFGFHPDDTTPIPRPSRYYGRRQDLVTLDRAQGRRNLEVRPSADTSIVPASPGLVPTQIDKSVLAIAEPKRTCVSHSPEPSVSKSATSSPYPLCRGHHRQLHQAGNEVAWWENLEINALEIAKGLWEQTHPKSAAADIQPNEDAAKTTT